MIIEMTQDDDGTWQYKDPDENDMVFELEAISGRELTSYDVLLNDVAQWVGHEKAHAHLVGLRSELPYKFKRYFDDTEALEMAVQRYWLALHVVRMNITGVALEQKDVRRKTQSKVAAKAPRPGAKSPLRAEIAIAMRSHKSDCANFQTFMSMWSNQHLNGLTIKTFDHKETYVITDENGDMGEKRYAWGSLEAMYSQAK